MTMFKKCILTVTMAALVQTTLAQGLSLDSCRALALNNNKELRISELNSEAAHWQHKATVTNYLPKISAMGTYQHFSRSISLLNSDQKNTLNNLGTSLTSSIALPQGFDASAFLQTPQVQQLLQSYPILQQLLADPTVQQYLNPLIAGTAEAYNKVLASVSDKLDAAGQKVVSAFETDTRNLFAATVMLTQPIYMGGKIVAYDHITKYAEQIAAQKHDMALQDVVVGVDEAYWRIVALQSKKELAEGFLALVQKLDTDVSKLVEAGMATKADGLKVKVKVNEAELAVIQVNNGLVLSRMALAQLCGLPLDAQFTLEDEAREDEAPVVVQNEFEDTTFVAQAMATRPEIQALELAAKVREEQVKVARAEYLPQLALMGGYTATSPSLFNSYEKDFKGMWNVGVMLKIPIVTWGERIYKVRQAKAEATIAALESQDVQEKITLQVNQSRQKLQEARERLNTATRTLEHADENLRTANLGLEEGVIPVSDVLGAQTAWLQAHATKVEAEVDLHLADVYLSRALGTIYK